MALCLIRTVEGGTLASPLRYLLHYHHQFFFKDATFSTVGGKRKVEGERNKRWTDKIFPITTDQEVRFVVEEKEKWKERGIKSGLTIYFTTEHNKR